MFCSILPSFLGDRKSESYALQWKHINTKEQEIQLVQALDKYKNPKFYQRKQEDNFFEFLMS